MSHLLLIADPLGEEYKKYNCKNLKAIYLAGERCDPDTIEFYGSLLNKPIIDHFWQTETGWPVAGQAMVRYFLQIDFFPKKLCGDE